MGSCLCKGKGQGGIDHNDPNEHNENQKATYPTFEHQNSSLDISKKPSNTASKYSITAPPSNRIGTSNHETKNENGGHERKNSFESQTKQILCDEDIFSREAIRVAHQFWVDNVAILSEDRRQEIGVSLYAQMFRKMPGCRKIFLRGDIQETASKFLSMVGWLVMELVSNNTDVWVRVKKLGTKHRLWGISYENYLPMLQAFHITFQDQFKKSYTLRVKFCIENLFMNAAKIMTEKDFVTLFAERVEDLESLEFLDSLDACLAHQTGREYFERYLEQTFCAEFVIFLKAFDEYKQLGNVQQRYEKALELYVRCFDPRNSDAPIDLKKEHMPHIDIVKKELEHYKETLTLSENEENDKMYELKDTLLDQIYSDIKQILEEQSWAKFHSGIYSIKQATRMDNY